MKLTQTGDEIAPELSGLPGQEEEAKESHYNGIHRLFRDLGIHLSTMSSSRSSSSSSVSSTPSAPASAAAKAAAAAAAAASFSFSAASSFSCFLSLRCWNRRRY